MSASSKPAKPAKYQCPIAFSGGDKEAEGRIYKLASKSDCLQFRELADKTDKFVLRYDQDEILVWDRKKSGEPMNLIKVFGTFKCSPETLWDMLHDAQYRGEWDHNRIEGYELSHLDDRQSIGYYAAKSPSPISNRDFVNQRIWHDAGNGEYVIFNTSVSHNGMPDRDGFVRAKSKITGYLVRPYGTEGGCCLTYLTQTDPSGWIPTFVINFATTKLVPSVMHNLRKASEGYPEWVKSQKEHTRSWAMKSDPWDKPQTNHTIDQALQRWMEDEAAISSPVHAPTPKDDRPDGFDETVIDDTLAPVADAA